MKFCFSVVVSLICVAAYGQTSFTTDPNKLRYNVSDVINFWAAYDQLAKATTHADSVRIMDEGYLQKGTRGFKLYQQLSSSTPDQFVAVVQKHPKLLRCIRASSLSIPRYRNTVVASAKKLKQLYPDAQFPELFFCIGKFEVSGSREGDVLYIGVELNSLTAKSPKDELTNPYIRANAGTIDRLEAVCLHETAHYQQKLTPKTNLEAAMTEGGAEFVALHLTGKSTMQPVFDQITPELEQAIKREFTTVMEKPIDAKWFLAFGDPATNRPGMLGYVIGYRICEAYYKKATNKTEAIRNIITLDNYREIYEKSGYGK